MNPNGNVIPFPQQPGMPPQADGSLLPPFPLVAMQIEATARRIPWYAWLVIGAYAMFRLLRSR